MPTLSLNLLYLLVQADDPLPVLLLVLGGLTGHVLNSNFLLAQPRLSHDLCHGRSTDSTIGELTLEEQAALINTQVRPSNLVLLAADELNLFR
jgi:hypothetical protein